MSFHRTQQTSSRRLPATRTRTIWRRTNTGPSNHCPYLFQSLQTLPPRHLALDAPSPNPFGRDRAKEKKETRTHSEKWLGPRARRRRTTNTYLRLLLCLCVLSRGPLPSRNGPKVYLSPAPQPSGHPPTHPPFPLARNPFPSTPAHPRLPLTDVEAAPGRRVARWALTDDYRVRTRRAAKRRRSKSGRAALPLLPPRALLTPPPHAPGGAGGPPPGSELMRDAPVCPLVGR